MCDKEHKEYSGRPDCIGNSKREKATFEFVFIAVKCVFVCDKKEISGDNQKQWNGNPTHTFRKKELNKSGCVLTVYAHRFA